MTRRPIVTGWFRSPNIWPILERYAARRQPVSIWTGACASGEEAYSIAIMLERAGIAGSVHASDLDSDLVRTAKKGRYRPESIANSRDPDIERWLVRTGRDFQVRTAVRDRVSFSVAELGVDPVPPCDIAFTRNVWRHLSPRAQRLAAEDCVDALPPDGRLVLGGSDFYDARLRDHTPSSLLALFEEAEHPLIYRPRKATP